MPACALGLIFPTVVNHHEVRASLAADTVESLDNRPHVFARVLVTTGRDTSQRVTYDQRRLLPGCFGHFLNLSDQQVCIFIGYPKVDRLLYDSKVWDGAFMVLPVRLETTTDRLRAF
ncbi:hypothetical protein WS50_12755 [Burkholderia territorii]|nr:hypothetical protein WS47_30620 [Burkholderia territorii]KUZ17645.1 hypothetical protein WS50_12755 [Burkholderia territorii]